MIHGQLSAPFVDMTLNVLEVGPGAQKHENVYIDGQSGIFFDGDGRVIRSTCCDAVMWLPRWIFRDIKPQELSTEVLDDRLRSYETRFQERLNEVQPETLHAADVHVSLLHPFGWYAYGHFFDTFQRLLEFDRLGLLRGPSTALLISDPRAVCDFDLHLQALGVDRAVKVHNRPQGQYKIWRADSAWYCPPLTFPATFTPESYSYVHERYLTHFGGGSAEPRGKLFLARTAGKQSRYIVNFEAIAQALQPLGVTLVHGNEPLKTIVELFSRASHVAGYHGSLFANSIFSSESTRYLEYCPINRPDRSFAIKHKLATDYDHRLIETDAQFNATLPIDELVAFFSGP